MNLEKTQNNLSIWLINPFHYWGGSKALWIGLFIIALHIPAGYGFDARFDGALDMHLTASVDSLLRPLIDVLVAWGSMVLCMYLSALAFKSPIRLIDIAGSVAIARIPLLISVIPALFFEPDIQQIEELFNLQGTELILLTIGAFIILLFFIWFLVLLFNAYKVNSNLKGWRLGVGFAGSLILAEILSILILFYI